MMQHDSNTDPPVAADLCAAANNATVTQEGFKYSQMCWSWNFDGLVMEKIGKAPPWKPMKRNTLKPKTNFLKWRNLTRG